jgi:hypothetical protein
MGQVLLTHPGDSAEGAQGPRLLIGVPGGSRLMPGAGKTLYCADSAGRSGRSVGLSRTYGHDSVALLGQAEPPHLLRTPTISVLPPPGGEIARGSSVVARLVGGTCAV